MSRGAWLRRVRCIVVRAAGFSVLYVDVGRSAASGRIHGREAIPSTRRSGNKLPIRILWYTILLEE